MATTAGGPGRCRVNLGLGGEHAGPRVDWRARALGYASVLHEMIGVVAAASRAIPTLALEDDAPAEIPTLSAEGAAALVELLTGTPRRNPRLKALLARPAAVALAELEWRDEWPTLSWVKTGPLALSTLHYQDDWRAVAQWLQHTDGHATLDAAKAEALRIARAAGLLPGPAPNDLLALQARVSRWMHSTFGAEAATDRWERAARVVEEAIEIGQAEGLSGADVARIMGRVYSRPAGEPSQEAAGVMVTLLAWAAGRGVDLLAVTAREVERIEQPETVRRIREKQAEKAAAGTGKAYGAPPIIPPEEPCTSAPTAEAHATATERISTSPPAPSTSVSTSTAATGPTTARSNVAALGTCGLHGQPHPLSQNACVDWAPLAPSSSVRPPGDVVDDVADALDEDAAAIAIIEADRAAVRAEALRCPDCGRPLEMTCSGACVDRALAAAEPTGDLPTKGELDGG